MIRIQGLKIPVENDNEEALKAAVMKKLGVGAGDLGEISIRRRSVDARDKKDIHFVYTADAELKNEKSVLKKRIKDVSPAPDETYRLPECGQDRLEHRPVIVGSGPAGLFCALMLSRRGFRPLVLERGSSVDERTEKVRLFWEKGILDPDSNVQFGEGGAGTFSDGKLKTGTRDREHRGLQIMREFVSAGAPGDIMYSAKPHIGTDILRKVIKNIRQEIEQNGGEFSFNCRMDDIETENGRVKAVFAGGERIPADIVVLATGHSARDTFRMLYERGLSMEAKAFAVGVRVQHPQEMIGISQYGEIYKKLPPADYKLTYKAESGRGVYSFCMCPGGYVVNSSSEPGKTCVNGMSDRDRNSGNANSAVVVTVRPEDFFRSSPLDGIEFQRHLEERAWEAAGGKPAVPVQLLSDMRNGSVSKNFGGILPCVKGSTVFADVNGILPEYVCRDIIEAMADFGRKIKGFDRDDTLVFAVESRTSSPVRIPRDDDFNSSVKGIYPCGEGAGYAGGITSAAMDGMKTAERIIEKYTAGKV